MKKIVFFMIITNVCVAKLIPDNLITEPHPMQRFTMAESKEHLQRFLFGAVWGVSQVKLRGTTYENWLGVFTDRAWSRLIFMVGEDSLGNRHAKYIKALGEIGANATFDEPCGLMIDSTRYNGDSNKYYVYIADKSNNRIVRLYYDAVQESIYIYDSIGCDTVNNPEDVCCLSKPGGGAYLIITDTDNNRILGYQINSNLGCNYLWAYGTTGSGIGQFLNPTSAIMVPIDNRFYYVYVVDNKNFRVVCLKYDSNTSEITWQNEFMDSTKTVFFRSITSNPYYCVYVLDEMFHKVWVFTPGLEELLYTYGEYGYSTGQFFYPHDLCIYQNEIAITEHWGEKTGIQYFEIEPEVREIYPLSDTFDATLDSVKFNYKVCETSGYLTMKIEGKTIFQNQYHTPGTDTSPYWDGRDGNGKVVVPDTHYVYFHSPNHIAGCGVIDVKGTKIQDWVTELHWTAVGNPYVLAGYSYVDENDTLTIDTNVVIMGYNQDVYLQINGAICAIGNENDSVLFTAHRKLLPVEDSTYPGMWGGVEIPGRNSYSKMFYCQFEYANVPINLNDDTVKANCIEHSFIKDNNVAGQCNFWSAGGFGAGNEYVDNVTNKIFVYATVYEYGGRILDTLHIEKQPVPFYFPPYPSDFSQWYAVYGDESYAATLHIDPGTVLEFSMWRFIQIGYDYGSYNRRARLICEGTENDSIKFTTPADTIFGRGILFSEISNVDDTSIVSNTLFENMGEDHPVFELGDSTAINFSDSKFFNCRNYTIEMTGTNPYNNRSIQNCSFIQDSIPIVSSFSNVNAVEQCNFEDNIQNVIEVLADTVHKDMTIHKQEIPYVFLNHPEAGSNFELHGLDTIASLTVEAGTEILCDSFIEITIGESVAGMRGRLLAQGSATDLIHFKPLEQQNPWLGLRLLSYEPNDTSCLEHCFISHADSVGLSIHSNSPIIRNTTITNCYEGMRIYGTSTQPVIDSNTITLNWCGLHNGPSGATNLNISNSEICGNKIAIINDLTSSNINADSNWWGDASGPWDPTDSVSGPPDCNRYGRGDSIGDYVMYRPWSTSPMQTQTVTVIQPNGGDSLYCEGNYEIKWSRTTTPTRQELYYTLDFPQCSLSEEAFWQSIDTVTVSESSYVWSVPNTPSNRYRVAVKSFYDAGKSSYAGGNYQSKNRVSEETNASRFIDEVRSTSLVAIDVSDSNSSIVDTISPAITLIEPNGGEYVIPSVEDTIRWQASDNHKLGCFDILYSVDNGQTYGAIEENVPTPCSTYYYTFPEENSYVCKVKVVAHDSSDNCKDDVSDSVFSIPIKSKINEMTAYNNAYRMRRIFSQGLHLVYSHKTDVYGSAENSDVEPYDNNANLSRDRLTKKNEINNGGGPPPRVEVEKVYYIKSTNNGHNWFDPILMGQGIYPAMAMNGDASKIGVAWTNLTSTKVLYNHYRNGRWRGLQTLLDEVTDVTYSPVAVQYASDSIHLVTLRNTVVDEDELVQDVLYLKFPYTNPYSVFMDTIDHWRICGEDDSMPRFVSLAVDNSNFPHVAWEKPPGDTMFNAPLPAFDIFYAGCLISGWTTWNISNTDDKSIYPSIEYYGGHVYVVWQEKIDGYCIFLYKRNYTQFPPVTETDTISQTSGNSWFPVTKKGGIILWSVGDPGEIYGRIWNYREEIWLEIENWSNTEKSSHYPVVDAWQNEGGTDIMAGWTEDTSICGYGQKYVSFFPSKDNDYVAFPSYCLKLGDSMSTPFTRYRDGVAVHDNRKFDVGIDSLIYFLPYIDIHAICRVYLELYRPKMKGQPTNDNKWKIRLDVDGTMNHNINLSPGEFKIVELNVPKVVNSDGKATIKFEKIDGECILVRRILFFEFERNEEIALMQNADGCQGSETQFISPVLLSGLYPNPAKGILRIRLRSPDEQQMKIRLYDITGRIVNEIFNGKVVQGVNEIQMSTNKLAAGVYFIRVETDKTTEIEKVIIVK